VERTTTQSKRFEQRAQLGSGTFGTVYEVFDHHRGHTVALKRLHKVNPEALLRFKKEFRSLADVSHRNLISLYELFESDGDWFFSMELIRGFDLVKHLRRNLPDFGGDGTEESSTTSVLPDSAASAQVDVLAGTAVADPSLLAAPTGKHIPVQVQAQAQALPDTERLQDRFAQLAIGLSALHDRDFLHCDLKPANILVDSDGRVVLLDFGLLTKLDHRHVSNKIAGTPLYMAPEQWLGDPPSTSSDWYSFGVILYEALLGVLPHRGKLLELMAAKTQIPVEPLRLLNPNIPEHLDNLCLELLNIAPARRPDAREILARLTGKSIGSFTSRRQSNTFVGRSAELLSLQEEFAQCSRGGSRTVLLHGGTGLGKTALCEQFLAKIDPEECTILRGRCFEQESLPYKALDAVIDELTETIHRLSPTPFGAVAGTRELTKLFPVLERALIGGHRSRLTFHNPIEIKRRAQSALRTILFELGRSKPILIWVDDVLWGDRDSATLLFNILQGADSPRAMLLLTYRSDEVDQSPFLVEFNRLLAEQIASIPTLELGLTRFSASECEDLVTHILADDTSSSPKFIRKIIRETGGSPLLIDELVRFSRSKSTHETLETDVSAVVGSFERNLKLSGMLEQRITALPSISRQLHEVVCLAGVPITFDTAHEAIGVPSLEPRLLNRLRFEHLLRLHTSGEQQLLAPYHDRVRTLTIETMSVERRVTLHRQIADSLARRPSTPARLLADHYHGAGMDELASSHALRAAQAADAALAFEDASLLYERALLWWPGDPDRQRMLRRRQADALVNCGRCGEAAPLYLELQQDAQPAQARELRRFAAQAHITCGNIEQGLALLKDCLRDVGMKYPASARRATLEIATTLVRLKLSRARYTATEHAPKSDPRVTEQIATCFLASRNVQLISPLHSMAFGMRALKLSIDSGTIEQLIEGLFQVGAALAITERKDGRDLVAQAYKLVRKVDSLRIKGIAAHWQGLIYYGRGEWPSALASFEQAHQALAQAPGSTTELQKAEVNIILTLQLLGDFRALSHRTEQTIIAAQKSGDRYTEVAALLYSSVARLAADDLQGARRRIQNAVRRAPDDAYTGFSQLKFDIWCDLYAGDAPSAYTRIEQAWPKITSSRMNALSAFRIVMRALRVGCLLELAVQDPSGRVGHLKRARKTLRLLVRDPFPAAKGTAAMLQAAFASQTGTRAQAIEFCQVAAVATKNLERPLDTAHALRRWGELEGDKIRTEEADQLMHARGVVHPERWLRCQSPGFLCD